jgi:hypothetical protein
VFRTALGSTQPPIQWVPGALSVGVKRPAHEADHSPPSSAEIEECVELYLHSQYAFMAWCLVKHRDNFTFYLYHDVCSMVYLFGLLFLCLVSRVTDSHVVFFCGSLETLENYLKIRENPEGKRPLGRPGRACEDNIRMDLSERG